MELLFCNTHNPLDCQITSDYSAIKVITDVLTGEERRGESPAFWEVAVCSEQKQNTLFLLCLSSYFFFVLFSLSSPLLQWKIEYKMFVVALKWLVCMFRENNNNPEMIMVWFLHLNAEIASTQRLCLELGMGLSRCRCLPLSCSSSSLKKS